MLSPFNLTPTHLPPSTPTSDLPRDHQNFGDTSASTLSDKQPGNVTGARPHPGREICHVTDARACLQVSIPCPCPCPRGAGCVATATLLPLISIKPARGCRVLEDLESQAHVESCVALCIFSVRLCVVMRLWVWIGYGVSVTVTRARGADGTGFDGFESCCTRTRCVTAGMSGMGNRRVVVLLKLVNCECED